MSQTVHTERERERESDIERKRKRERQRERERKRLSGNPRRVGQGEILETEVSEGNSVQ